MNTEHSFGINPKYNQKEIMAYTPSVALQDSPPSGVHPQSD